MAAMTCPSATATTRRPRPQRVDPALGPDNLDKVIAGKLNLKTGGPLLYGIAGSSNIWISPALTKRQRALVLKETLARLRAHPQVAAAFSAAQIAAAAEPSGPPETWTLIERARGSFGRDARPIS